MRFSCRTCGAVLTRDVEPLDDLDRLRTEPGEQYLPRGRYVVADGRYWHDEHAGDVALHSEDVIGVDIEGEWGEGREEHYGCCGLNGGAGPNTICPNGHLVATEFSECQLPRCTLLDGEAVTATE